MAMLEKQLFDDGVGRGGTGGDLDLAAAAAAANSKSTTAGPTSSRLRIPTDQDACGKCGTTVPAIAISKAAYLSATSTTSGQLSSGHAPGNNSSEDHRHSRQAGADTSSSLTSIEHRRSEPRMLGMRGGLDAAGGAAEPISGLAAFGSQRSISDATNSIALASKPGGGTRLSPIQSITSSRPTPEVCTCQQKEKDSRTRPSGGGGGGGGGSGDGGNGGGGSSQGDMGYPNTSGGGPPSQGPFRGEAGGIGGGAGGGTKGSDGVPPRDEGYRVLQWSQLSNLSYMTMGAMCEIYSAELDGVKVAVKIPRKDCEEPAVAAHDLEVELDVLKRVRHKNIIALIGAGLREEMPNRFLVLEYLELGTLADKLDAGSMDDDDSGKESNRLRHQKRTKRYQEFYMVTMLERSLELAMALEHLHHHMPETFVVHRDLKPDNVGIKADGTLKLFDFGLARVVKRRNRVNARYEMTGETGSMRYMAPEVVESLPYNEKVDVYAFGLLLWEMLEGRRVFDGMGVTDFYERVVNAGARPNLDPSWPQDLRKLISQCWHADVDRRPHFRVIAKKLKELYTVEKNTSTLCMSALNLNEQPSPKMRGGGMLARSATSANVIGTRGRSGSTNQRDSGARKGGVLRRSFSKMSRIFHTSKKGGDKATFTHTAPEAYARNSRGMVDPIPTVGRVTMEYSNGVSELSEQAIYGDSRRVTISGDDHVTVNRANTDGVILREGARGRR